jgi:NADH-quinone oxidoreductase subunit M
VVKLYTLAATLVELALAVLLVWGAAVGVGGWAELVREPVLRWLPGWGVTYQLGMDGISLPLVLLTVVLLPLVVLGSWRGIEAHWPAYAAALLLLTTGVLGTVLALDLVLFYVFWELMLVPMYLLIGVWGGERRIYAAVKFFLYTMGGSLLMLLAILWLGWTHLEVTGRWSFAYADLLRLDLPLRQELWLFAAFALAFAIKVPMFPLHTWLPDAHVEAPTGGSVILAGVMLKMGTYGFLRFALPLFPRAAFEAQGVMLALAVVGILYGALVAWVQADMKKLVAYSSVAHLGFVMLGLFAFELTAWQGSLLQMVNHGLSTGALFLLVGMVYERRHSKKFADLGGLAKPMPRWAFFLVFASLASVGLPLLNGFVGEFLILVGTYWAHARTEAVLAAFGVVLAAVYLFRLLHESIWGPLRHPENESLPDLGAREVWTVLPLCLLMLAIGVMPQPFLAPSERTLRTVLREVVAAGRSPAPSEARLAPPTAGGRQPQVAATDPGRIRTLTFEEAAVEPAPAEPPR